ncbi:MAG: hypothetical protein CMM50_14680 [Rhodospirillaceae bacterium]|nr:hypothetical protein [Rhodospirillaceae bacterium]
MRRWRLIALGVAGVLIVAALVLLSLGREKEVVTAAAEAAGASTPVLSHEDISTGPVEVSAASDGSGITLGLWVKPEDCDTDAPLVRLAVPNGGSWQWRLADHRLQYQPRNTGDGATLETVCEPQWRHLAVVHEDGRATLYVDGTRLDAGTMPGPPADGSSLVVSAEGTPAGEILGLAVFPRALGAKEVAALAAETPRPGVLLPAVLVVLALLFLVLSHRRALSAALWLAGGLVVALILGETATRLAAGLNLLDPHFIALMEQAQTGNPWRRDGFVLTDSKTVAPPDDVYAAGDRYYRNRPSVDSLWHEYIPYTHDQYGFRAIRPVSRWAEKPSADGPIRVVVMGDSMTYGVGVENDQTYPAVAQRWLDRWAPGRFVVINAGVPGFSIQHLEPYYRNQIRAFAPEWIVHGVFMPDFARRQIFQKPGDTTFYLPDDPDAAWRRWLRPSYFASFVAYGLAIIDASNMDDREAERIERMRSTDALKRLMNEVQTDGPRLTAFLLPHQLFPRTASADELFTDDAWLDRDFAAVANLYHRHDADVVSGYDALIDHSTGQCFEYGRVNRPGHYSPLCNLLLGRALATYLYKSNFDAAPPSAPIDEASPTTPMPASSIPRIADVDPIEIVVGDQHIPLVPVPAGSAEIGEPVAEAMTSADEALRDATIAKPFFIMRHEVTNGLWDIYARATGQSDVLENHLQGGVDLAALGFPRPYVSRADSEAFAAWLSQQTGARFRVPTEDEWEWAAKLGFGGGAPLRNVAVYDIAGSPAATCSRSPDRLGLCDMLGNMAEIVIPPGRGEAVFKGGSYTGGPLELRPAARQMAPPDRRFSHVGLRLVVDMQTPAGANR